LFRKNHVHQRGYLRKVDPGVAENTISHRDFRAIGVGRDREGQYAVYGELLERPEGGVEAKGAHSFVLHDQNNAAVLDGLAAAQPFAPAAAGAKIDPEARTVA